MEEKSEQTTEGLFLAAWQLLRNKSHRPHDGLHPDMNMTHVCGIMPVEEQLFENGTEGENKREEYLLHCAFINRRGQTTTLSITITSAHTHFCKRQASRNYYNFLHYTGPRTIVFIPEGSSLSPVQSESAENQMVNFFACRKERRLGQWYLSYDRQWMGRLLGSALLPEGLREAQNAQQGTRHLISLCLYTLPTINSNWWVSAAGEPEEIIHLHLLPPLPPK